MAKRSHKFGDKVTAMTDLPGNLDPPIYYQPTDQSFEGAFALASRKSVS